MKESEQNIALFIPTRRGDSAQVNDCLEKYKDHSPHYQRIKWRRCFDSTGVNTVACEEPTAEDIPSLFVSNINNSSQEAQIILELNWSL